jgi:hypothetical protein
LHHYDKYYLYVERVVLGTSKEGLRGDKIGDGSATMVMSRVLMAICNFRWLVRRLRASLAHTVPMKQKLFFVPNPS